MNRLYIAILGLSAAVVSIVGAYFSISGLSKLFSGAPLAVMIMAGALELAKMVSASFLHSNWSRMHLIMRLYLSMAVVILMCITSLGIFGYLRYAFENTNAQLKVTNTQIQYHESRERQIQKQLDELQKAIDEVPSNRVTAKLAMQEQLSPKINELQKSLVENKILLRNESLKKVEHEREIGPVIYVAELAGADTNHVATYLIVLFVIVFDPLAVCLVLATSFAAKNFGKDEEGPVVSNPSSTSTAA